MSRKRTISIVDIVFLAIVLIGTFYILYSKYYLNIIFIYSIIDTILKSTLLLIMYFVIRVAFYKAYISKLSKIDLKNDNYYRDVVRKYSPAVLKYIDDFEFGDTIIIVILMGLRLKGIINNELMIINNDFSELDLNEKYICININKLKYVDMEKLEATIIDDCKRHKLLEDDKSKKDISSKTITFLIIGLPLIIMIIGMMNNMLLFLAVALAVIIIIAFVVYYVTSDEVNYTKPYKRTKKGEELNEKLEGGRKFLEDYTSLESKSDDELIIWEDYLIYSVIFNQNKKIIKEYQEKIDRM